MLAEAVHSVADTPTRASCCSGASGPSAPPPPEHPFGYGRDRFFYSFVVALLLFTLGSVFALYEGIEKLAHPGELTSPIVAIIILLVAICLEGFSFRTAIHESRELKGRLSWWQFIRQSTTPELPVVLLEDFGALIGLVLALLGVGLTLLTGEGVFDALGTIGIGLLLGVIAIVLIIEMKSLLIGEGARPPVLAAIVDGLGRRRAGRHPPAHAVPRAGGAPGRGQDRADGPACRWRPSRGRSTRRRPASARPSPRPG